MKKLVLALTTLVVLAACSQNPYADKSLAASFALNVDSTLDDMDVFIRNWNEAKLFSAETAHMVKTKNFSEMGMGITYGMGVINLLGTCFGHAARHLDFSRT